MPRRIEITAHLSTAELGDRFRQSTDVVERGHYQIIWLLAQGRSTADVAESQFGQLGRAEGTVKA